MGCGNPQIAVTIFYDTCDPIVAYGPRVFGIVVVSLELALLSIEKKKAILGPNPKPIMAIFKH
jgi:hypothetical protein